MKSRPLSKTIREATCRALVKDMFAKDFEAWKVEQHRLALKLYNKLYSRKEREALATLGEGWFGKKKSFRVAFGGDVQDMSLEHLLYFKDAHSSSRYQPLLAFKATDLFSEILVKHWDRYQTLTQDRRKFRNEVMAQLESVRTTKQLFEVWPEVIKWVPDGVATTGNSLPAVQVDDINKQICDKLGTKSGACEEPSK